MWQPRTAVRNRPRLREPWVSGGNMIGETSAYGGGKELDRSRPVRLRALVLGLAILLAGLLAACGSSQTEPAPEGPPRATLEPTAVSVVSAAVCQRIDSAGKIVVGTAGDYPPFEYYTNRFRLDGFDIARSEEHTSELQSQPNLVC